MNRTAKTALVANMLSYYTLLLLRCNLVNIISTDPTFWGPVRDRAK